MENLRGLKLLILLPLFIMVNLVVTRPTIKCCLSEHDILLQRQAEAICVLCPVGSYCKKDAHSNTVCHSCSEADIYNNEFVIQNCTLTSDTVIGCPVGYFRLQIQQEFSCSRCTKCRNTYEARPCDNTTDTVCCSHPGMEVSRDGRGAFWCGLTCNPGEYLDAVDRRCVPCPSRTYQTAGDHNFTSCWPCFNYLAHNDRDTYRLVQECDATHNEEIECSPGFYKRQVGDPNYNEAQCNYCSICHLDPVNRYQVRSCDKLTDTLCCPKPNMISISTTDGHKCGNAIKDSNERSNDRRNFESGEVSQTDDTKNCSDTNCSHLDNESTNQKDTRDVSDLSLGRSSTRQARRIDPMFTIVSIIGLTFVLIIFLGARRA